MKRDLGRAAEATKQGDLADTGKDIKKAGEHAADYVGKTVDKAKRAVERNVS